MLLFKNTFLGALAVLFFTACQHSDQTSGQVPAAKPADSTEEIVYDDGGPPFSDTCLCSFAEFGAYRISNNNYNIYKNGKGWNPDHYSCSWIWGEDINNIFPEDTNVRVMKIHLLDLARFTIPTNGTEYGHDSIKKHVIAVYIRDSNKGRDTCIFDPYKAGTYPKPQQWVE